MSSSTPKSWSDLTPETVAGDIGLSGRTLARNFAERDETVMRRVFGERVTEAAAPLAPPAWAHQTITEIAFASGINDLSRRGDDL